MSHMGKTARPYATARAEARGKARPRRSRTATVNRLLADMLLLVTLQIGLFTRSLEDALGRHYDRAVAYSILSAACFAASLLVLRALKDIDSTETD